MRVILFAILFGSLAEAQWFYKAYTVGVENSKTEFTQESVDYLQSELRVRLTSVAFERFARDLKRDGIASHAAILLFPHTKMGFHQESFRTDIVKGHVCFSGSMTFHILIPSETAGAIKLDSPMQFVIENPDQEFVRTTFDSRSLKFTLSDLKDNMINMISISDEQIGDLVQGFEALKKTQKTLALSNAVSLKLVGTAEGEIKFESPLYRGREVHKALGIPTGFSKWCRDLLAQ